MINLINGLFKTDYPTDSTITYNWTEHVGEDLRTCLADTILTINEKHSYHLEAQMTEDENIVLRVFEYGFGHARKNVREDTITSLTLHFPEPKVILLFSDEKAPDEYLLNLDFGTQGTFLYKVTTFKYLDTTPEELTRKKMIILIPFELLKLRRLIEKKRTPETLDALKHLIFHDIIGAIQKNEEAGNITVDDARKLRGLTHRLYRHIYSHYEELEEINEMTDESLLLDIEIVEKKLEKKRKQELSAKDEIIATKDSEIAALKAEIERLKNNK